MARHGKLVMEIPINLRLIKSWPYDRMLEVVREDTLACMELALHDAYHHERGFACMRGLEDIPDAWLMGRCQALEREGYGPREAVEEAARHWFEQKRLAEWAEDEDAPSSA
ncbi:MAG: hypothetical protein GY769_08135 [bacterium]|nr:hypothetical protein [bacterium]